MHFAHSCRSPLTRAIPRSGEHAPSETDHATATIMTWQSHLIPALLGNASYGSVSGTPAESAAERDGSGRSTAHGNGVAVVRQHTGAGSSGDHGDPGYPGASVDPGRCETGEAARIIAQIVLMHARHMRRADDYARRRQLSASLTEVQMAQHLLRQFGLVRTRGGDIVPSRQT